jgi:RNA polymerase sigma factor (sigma-70 family)
VFLFLREAPLADADVLFAEHQQAVFRYLWRVVGQADAARDLTQEVFLRVSRAEAPAEGDDARRAWVFRIARNLAINHLRDRGRQPPITTLAAETAHPATQELGLALEQALGALPELDRDAFLLRESAGLSYAEIAVACDISPDAVRARLHRTRQQLRDQLGRSLVDRLGRGIRLR